VHRQVDGFVTQLIQELIDHSRLDVFRDFLPSRAWFAGFRVGDCRGKGDVKAGRSDYTNQQSLS
jgi:hypothetical protein